jgi:hypothetical protein
VSRHVVRHDDGEIHYPFHFNLLLQRSQKYVRLKPYYLVAP